MMPKMMIAVAAMSLVTVSACQSAQEASRKSAAASDVSASVQPSVASAPVQPAVFVQNATTQPTGQPVRIMTYNVENFAENFKAFAVSKTTQPDWPPAALELIARERKEDDEENWEVARTITDVKPDIWVLQEGCDGKDLNYFNTQFLQGYFETVHIFKTNTERGQNTAILVRPGFKVLEFREDYRNEPDTNHVNPIFDKLFARGPGFALIQAPNGTKFWVGTNHAKSKSDNSLEVTKWRNAEAERTNQIVNEVKKIGPPQVFFLGDMNDELGMDEFEKQAGGSAIEKVAGTGATALTILTKPLVDRGEISYGGYRSARHRSFIDHAFATPEAAEWVKYVYVFRGDLADVASDHYPVVVDAVIK